MVRVQKKKEKQLAKVLLFLEKNYNIPSAEILTLIQTKEKEKEQQEKYVIPVSLFTNIPLSSLETITVYLREVQQLRFSEMEKILGRSQIALSTTYRNAKKKYPKKIIVSHTKYYVPCHIFVNRKLSVLETLVLYLKEQYSLPNYEIAKLLKKDSRTIWTVLSRVKIKNEANKK